MNTTEPSTHCRYTLECCVDSTISAVHAKQGGADRLELCSNLVIGGTTPTLSLFQQIRENVDIRIHALLRPRFGDFLYSKQEQELIIKEIDMFRQAGADGIVIGALTADGDLDCEAMKKFIDHSGTMSITLHRAFDMCRDPFQTLEDAVSMGVNTILTSGCQPSCLQGIDLLRQLDEKANGALQIMAGAGIDAAAVQRLLRETKLTAFHMSGKKVTESGMQFRNPTVSMGIPGMSEYEIWETNPEAVAAVRKLLL